MKVKVNYRKSDSAPEFFAWMGRLDNDGKHSIGRFDNFRLSGLPKDAMREVQEGHDILIQIIPKIDILVLAKNAEDLNRYMETLDADTAMDRFMAMTKYNISEEGRLWTTYDFPAEI